VELNTFYISFYLNENDSQKFMNVLKTRVNSEGLKLLKSKYFDANLAWCKLDKIPEQGPEEYIFITGKGKDKNTYYMTSVSYSEKGDAQILRENWLKYCTE
jgi:hypothetical protein